MTGVYMKCNTALRWLNPPGYSPDRVNSVKIPNPMSFQCKIIDALLNPFSLSVYDHFEGLTLKGLKKRR